MILKKKRNEYIVYLESNSLFIYMFFKLYFLSTVHHVPANRVIVSGSTRLARCWTIL